MAGGHGDYVDDGRVIAMSAGPNWRARHDFSQVDWQASEYRAHHGGRYLKQGHAKWLKTAYL